MADLVVFSQVLEEFKEMSGMAANSSKSEVLFFSSGVNVDSKSEFLGHLKFKED